MSNCNESPSLRLSSSWYSVDTDTRGLPASSGVNHLPAVISLSRLSSSVQVMFWSRSAKSTATGRRELDVVDRLAIDVRHARANHGPHAHVFGAALLEELRELLVLVGGNVDEEEVGRIRPASCVASR